MHSLCKISSLHVTFIILTHYRILCYCTKPLYLSFFTNTIILHYTQLWIFSVIAVTKIADSFVNWKEIPLQYSVLIYETHVNGNKVGIYLRSVEQLVRIVFEFVHITEYPLQREIKPYLLISSFLNPIAYSRLTLLKTHSNINH